jgi:tetratricopeptide (TPR) repeat protein
LAFVESADLTTRAAGFGLPAFGWIMGPWQDFLLFIGTPLIIVPLVLLAQQAWSLAILSGLVASFGAMGHHLPGMMRAYGDRALFARFRVRFIVAPLLLLAVCLGLRLWNSSPLNLAIFGWGLWHAFMQAHGIARIYDAKAGSVDASTIRLDFLLLGCWFLGVVLLSPLRLPQLIGFLYDCGLPVVAPAVIEALRGAAATAMLGVTAVYAVHALRRTRAGTPPSALKLVLHVTTIGFWAFCNIAVGHVLLAILLFEIFHDVQYLAIVWVFNRRRVDSDPAAGAFTRFLFRQRGYLVVLYVALVAGYGSLNLPRAQTSEVYGFDDLLGGIVAASTLLHFYYDGFIWKLREADVSRTLGVRADALAGPIGRARPGLRHALRCTLFAAPLLLVVSNLFFRGSPISELERYASLAAISPGDFRIQGKLAELRVRDRDFVGAIEAGRRALDATDFGAANRGVVKTVRENLVTALMHRSQLLIEQGSSKEAEALLREATQLDASVPGKVRDAGWEAESRGQLAVADSRYTMATQIDPSSALAWVGLARVRLAQGRIPEARASADRAHALAPNHPVVAELQRALAEER